MADTPSFSTSDLKDILEQIAIPGSLANHPVLNSWIVAEYLRDHPSIGQQSPEYLIGQALEWQLELWSQEYPLTEAYRDDWLKIFCVKWLYFQKKPRLAAYQKHQTLKKLGMVLIDAEVLATLVPGKETRAEELLEAEEYRSFWYSFGDTNAALAPNRASEKLKAALEAFSTHIESRRLHKFAEPARVLTFNPLATSEHRSQQETVTAGVGTLDSASPQIGTIPSALAMYQQTLDRQHPKIAGYRPPLCQIDANDGLTPIPGEVAARRIVEQYQTVIVRGEMGIGKTAFLAQAVIQAARQTNLVPVWVSLPEYVSRESSSDLPAYISNSVFARWHPDLEDREAFRRELSQAERDRRVIWLLDGYEELNPAQRARAIRDIEPLERFVLTTRTSQPILNRRIDAQVQLLPISLSDAIDFIDTAYPMMRDVITDWAHHSTDVQRALGSGLILRHAAEIGQNSPQGFQLTAALDRAITQQLMTHTRFSNASDSDLIKHTRLMLGNLAWQTLSPQRETALSRDQVTEHELRTVWSATTKAPEEPPYDILRATGLVSEEVNHWNFWSDLIRDELAAEYAITEQLIQSELAFYPQYTRVIAFSAAKLMFSQQSGPAIRLLRNLLADSEEDPYGARWMTTVAILKECRLFQHTELDSIRRQVEQAFVTLWNGTASNRLKAWIAESLIAVQASSSMPAPDPALWEEVWSDFSAASPSHGLPTVLLAAGHGDLVKVASGSPAYDNDITHALIDALLLSDADMAKSAALHLRRRDLTNATVLEIEQSRRPVQRLAALALLHPTGTGAWTKDLRQMKTAQSLALAILSQSDILCNSGVLRWIPAGVIHMFMADLNLRIRLKDNKPMLITAGGREHVLSDDAYVPWW